MCSVAPESANQKESTSEESISEGVRQYASLEADEYSEANSDLMELAVRCAWLFFPLWKGLCWCRRGGRGACGRLEEASSEELAVSFGQSLPK